MVQQVLRRRVVKGPFGTNAEQMRLTQLLQLMNQPALRFFKILAETLAKSSSAIDFVDPPVTLPVTEVIENANIDQRKRLLEGQGQGLVRVSGLGATNEFNRAARRRLE